MLVEIFIVVEVVKGSIEYGSEVLLYVSPVGDEVCDVWVLVGLVVVLFDLVQQCCEFVLL